VSRCRPRRVAKASKHACRTCGAEPVNGAIPGVSRRHEVAVAWQRHRHGAGPDEPDPRAKTFGAVTLDAACGPPSGITQSWPRPPATRTARTSTGDRPSLRDCFGPVQLLVGCDNNLGLDHAHRQLTRPRPLAGPTSTTSSFAAVSMASNSRTGRSLWLPARPGSLARASAPRRCPIGSEGRRARVFPRRDLQATPVQGPRRLLTLTISRRR